MDKSRLLSGDTCSSEGTTVVTQVLSLKPYTHSQRGFDFKVLFQIEPPISILEFHSKL